MSYNEPKDPRTGKASNHQKAALKAAQNISNAEITSEDEKICVFCNKPIKEDLARVFNIKTRQHADSHWMCLTGPYWTNDWIIGECSHMD